ncbi:hypothetical protein CBW65_10035 [Tumebacillus avium]|uniref:Uncharacterized protein n=1 Tax=Tumebacillus avium TaxID=1903704 RepID=A0A1Y0IN95_9BACL|nr:hypothetical protein [Tumebacillus avium]ARU61296.1 hypothetical protein CBW65_10035 [Tumebacillus avium]
MKKAITSFVLGASLLAATATGASAYQYAYSIGTDYGLFDIDTSGDATTASNNFASAGYKSYYNTAPTVTYMRGNNPDTGTPRMESEILFFSAHANYDNMAWNYKGNDGSYMTGVYMGYNLDSTTGYKYAGIQSYDMNSVKLITFAGCKTALGTSNITKTAVDEGANTAVGWPDSIEAGSHTSWLARYTGKFVSGVTTVKNAVDYANSFTYSDNLVKNAKIYGNSSQIIPIIYAKDSSTAELSEVALDEAKRKHVPETAIQFDTVSPQYDELLSYIAANIDKSFHAEDYQISMIDQGTGSAVVDLVETVGEFTTTSGFVALVENNQVKAIYNNKIDTKPAKAKIAEKVSELQISDAKKLAKKQLKANYKELAQTGKQVLDLEKGKYYYVVFTEYQIDGTNLLGKEAYYYEVQ